VGEKHRTTPADNDKKLVVTRMNEVAILAVAYAAFNARDIDAVTAFMHPNVEWPNGMDGEHHSPRI
jgi:hypothetical protein